MANSMNHHEQGVCSKRLSRKAVAALARGAYTGVRKHDKGAKMPLADFFNRPCQGA